MGKGIKNALSVAVRSHSRTVELLVKKVSGFLTVNNVHVKENSVFLNGNNAVLNKVGAGSQKPACLLLKPFLFAHGGIASFVDSVRFADRLYGINNLLSEHFAGKGQKLNHNKNSRSFTAVGNVALGNKARNKICLSVDNAAAVHAVKAKGADVH